MSSSASEMYFVAVFQEETLAVTMERDGGVLLGLRGAGGLGSGTGEGVSPEVGGAWRSECLLKTLLGRPGGVSDGILACRLGRGWPRRARGDRR